MGVLDGVAIVEGKRAVLGMNLCDERPSHPQILWEPPNIGWKTGGPMGRVRTLWGAPVDVERHRYP